MENPASWGKVTRAIHEAIFQYEKIPEEERFYSLESTIYDHLRLKGYLFEEDEG